MSSAVVPNLASAVRGIFSPRHLCLRADDERAPRRYRQTREVVPKSPAPGRAASVRERRRDRDRTGCLRPLGRPRLRRLLHGVEGDLRARSAAHDAAARVAPESATPGPRDRDGSARLRVACGGIGAHAGLAARGLAPRHLHGGRTLRSGCRPRRRSHRAHRGAHLDGNRRFPVSGRRLWRSLACGPSRSPAGCPRASG